MSSFCSYSHFFSKKFQRICVSPDVNFNESLTNDVVSFEQLGPGFVLAINIPLRIVALLDLINFHVFCCYDLEFH